MTSAVEQRLRLLLAGGQLELPLPAAGRTAERLVGLAELAATEDLSTARLAEAHCDAIAITAEAGTSLPEGVLAGVWASRYGGGEVHASRHGDRWRLTGRLEFCSGADAAIGPPGFYLDRQGFWHGSVGVAACWAGAAIGVHRSTVARVPPADPQALAALGESAAACWELDAILHTAGRDIDERPRSVGMVAALTVRHLVVEACVRTMAATERATGPAPLAFDQIHAQRFDDLRMYIRQHHHGSDLATIGTAARSPDLMT